MRYLLDTNIVSAWARKSSSALMLKLAQTPRSFMRLHPGRARDPLRFRAPARDSGGSDDLRLLELLLSLPFGSAEARRAATMRNARPHGHTDRPLRHADRGDRAGAWADINTHNTREFRRVAGLVVEDWLA